ncbi:MAG: Nif3-like dinuclear metal center hexameric protein, partial [Phycisphaerales bacterium]
FKPISRLNAASRDTDAHVFACIAHGVAVYSPHTALDAAEGGTNDVLASLCNVKDPEPVEIADEPGEGECKVIVFVPAAEVDAVAEAMFAAGAGRIGEYDKCSFRVAGQGTFLGSDQTKPTIGQAGAFERVDEVRLESVAPAGRVWDVVRAIRATHSYEEPAFDIYPLHRRPAKGIGRQGMLDPPVQLGALAVNVKRSLQASCVQVVGDTHGMVKRAICMAGAAGGRMFQAGLGSGDVVVTGEIRHHDALAILRHGACAIAVNHWTSERPALKALAERLSVEVPGLTTVLSAADREPFSAA